MQETSQPNPTHSRRKGRFPTVVNGARILHPQFSWKLCFLFWQKKPHSGRGILKGAKPTLVAKINRYPTIPHMKHMKHDATWPATSKKSFPKAAFVSASCSSGQCDVVLFPPTGPGISPSLWALENTTQAEVKPTETSTEEDSRLSLKSKTKFHDEKKKHDFKSFQHLVKSKVVQQFSPVFFGEDKRFETKRFCAKKWLSATEARNAEYLSSSMSASLGRCECHRSQASQQHLQSFTPRIFVLKNGGKIEKKKTRKKRRPQQISPFHPMVFRRKPWKIHGKFHPGLECIPILQVFSHAAKSKLPNLGPSTSPWLGQNRRYSFAERCAHPRKRSVLGVSVWEQKRTQKLPGGLSMRVRRCKPSRDIKNPMTRIFWAPLIWTCPTVHRFLGVFVLPPSHLTKDVFLSRDHTDVRNLFMPGALGWQRHPIFIHILPLAGVSWGHGGHNQLCKGCWDLKTKRTYMKQQDYIASISW